MDRPLAYMITFTTYGTWLHGDIKGSVDKRYNRFGSEFVRSCEGLSLSEKGTLKNSPFVLDQVHRNAVLEAILEVCFFRNWYAYAVHVRNNHVHVVISGEAKAEKMMTDFKAYTTRSLKGLESARKVSKYWTRHGSTRYLWTKKSLSRAIEYVKYEQGELMAYGETKNGAPNVNEGV